MDAIESPDRKKKWREVFIAFPLGDGMKKGEKRGRVA